MKKNLTKAMALGMAFAMIGSATAFAEEFFEEPEVVCGKQEVPLTFIKGEAAGEDQLEDMGAFQGALKEETPEVLAQKAYIMQSGKVSDISEEDEKGLRVVTIDNAQGGLRFVLDSMTPVLDRATGGIVLASELKEGMEVAVVYGANSPMGMSMPPYLGSVTAVVANADKGFYMVGHFDENLTDAENQLQLNISEETSIQNTLGTRQMMTAEDVKDQDALVFYDATTRSIPAQTTPSMVMVLAAATEDAAPEQEEPQPETAQSENKAEDKAPALVPLRKTAEAMGWKVTWQGKDKPVLMEKGNIPIEISIGRAEYVVDGDEMMQAQLAAELQDGVLFVSDEVFAE